MKEQEHEKTMSSGGISKLRSGSYKSRHRRLPSALKRASIDDTPTLAALLLTFAVGALGTLCWWASDIVPPLFVSESPNKWFALIIFVCIGGNLLVLLAERTLYLINVMRPSSRGDLQWQLRQLGTIVASMPTLVLSTLVAFYTGPIFLISGGTFWAILLLNCIAERYGLFKHMMQTGLVAMNRTREHDDPEEKSPRHSPLALERQIYMHPIDDHDAYEPNIMGDHAVMQSYHGTQPSAAMELSDDQTNYTTGSIEILSPHFMQTRGQMPAIPLGSIKKKKQELKRQNSPRELRSVDQADRSTQGAPDTKW
jgi:hypothetical protein